MGHRHGIRISTSSYVLAWYSLGQKTSIGGKSCLTPCRLELLYESDVLYIDGEDGILILLLFPSFIDINAMAMPGNWKLLHQHY